MIPLRDHNPTRTVPYVNYAIIVANVAAFLWELAAVSGGASWVIPYYGLVPTRIVADPGGEALTVVTSMFLHGGWAHLGGNMLFLYVFGDNVEDVVGHGRYVAFYALSGLAAAAAQVLVDPTSRVPMVGASGAIAGVIAGYTLLYPRVPITTLNPFLPLWLWMGPLLVFPAWLVAGEFFVINLLSGVGSLGRASMGGVAFFAHIGGFVAGLFLIRPMSAGRRRSAKHWEGWRPPRGGRRGSRSDSGPIRDPWLH